MRTPLTQTWNPPHPSKMASCFTPSQIRWSACHVMSCAILAVLDQRRQSAGIANTQRCETLFQKRQTTKMRSNVGRSSVATGSIVPMGIISTRRKSTVNNARRAAKTAVPGRVILSGTWDAMHARQLRCHATIMDRIRRVAI